MRVETIPVGFLAANCYIVSDGDGTAAVIDPGDDAKAILKHLDDNGLRCDTILITHGHFDHVGAVVELKETTGAKLAISPLDERSLTIGYEVALNDDMTVEVGGLVFEVVVTPGHSPGGVCFLIEDALFTGDTLFLGTVGRVDIPGGDIGALKSSLERIKALPQEQLTIYPGHGQPTTLEFERVNNPFLI